MRRCAWALLLVACAPATGLLVEVQAPADLPVAVAKLDFVVAHPSWCERWVGDATAMHTTVTVKGRDLSRHPYDLLISPTHKTELSQPVYVASLAYDSDGKLVARATFGAHPFTQGQVHKRVASLLPFAVSPAPYVAGDGGCVCMPGEPWIGNGQGTGCDARVVPSFARLADTAGCELPKGTPFPDPVCDGQSYRDEVRDRALPCFADDDVGGCRVRLRRCADHDGVAWSEACATSGADVALPPGSTLCQRYQRCEEEACGDLVGCFRQSFAAVRKLDCRLAIDPSTKPGEPIRPCHPKEWQAALPFGARDTGCFFALVEGVAQPPFTLGLHLDGAQAPQALSTKCPAVLQVDRIEAPYPEAVPAETTFSLLAGEGLVEVTLHVSPECKGESSLLCSLQP